MKSSLSSLLGDKLFVYISSFILSFCIMCVDNDRGDMTHDTQSRSLCLTHGHGGGGGPAVASCVASILRLPAPPTAGCLANNVLHSPEKLPSFTNNTRH